MDFGGDVWNQVALEANQLYLEDGVAKSRFADTVSEPEIIKPFKLIIQRLLKKISVVSDNRKAAGQGVAQYLFLLISQRNL